MYITIDTEDLKRVKFEFNNIKKRNRIEKLHKDFVIYSIIMGVIILLLFYLYLVINNIPFLDMGGFWILNIITIVSFSFSPMLICVNKLKDEDFKDSRYRYLLDQFFINVNSKKKEMTLMSRKTNIKISLIKKNIKIYNDTLLLYDNKNIVAIILLYKLMNPKYLLDEIEKNVEVDKYED